MKTTQSMMITLGLMLAGCSGGGESTTAAMTAGSSDTGPMGSDSTTTTTTTGSSTTETPATDTTMGMETDSAESTGPEPTTGDTTGAPGCPPEFSIEGMWLSEGENVAPLLVATLSLVSIEANFAEDTFDVVSTDDMGAEIAQSGVYATELCPGEDNKYSIILDQTMPAAITVNGIFEFDCTTDPITMRYEVIQTEPDLGFPAPTCDSEFGMDPALGADNLQIFELQ